MSEYSTYLPTVSIGINDSNSQLAYSSLQIHKKDSYADLLKTTLLPDLTDLRLQKFSGVHQPCKDQIILFRYIAQLLLVFGNMPGDVSDS